MNQANDNPQPASGSSTAKIGVVYGVAAYLWWGLVPIYFKQVAHVDALEVLAHRVVWSVLLLCVLMRVYGRWGVAAKAIRSSRTMATLVATTILIAINWYIFIWAVANNQILQASLGYFINPLVNVLLGFFILRERLRAWQWVSVALATAGVSYLTIDYGSLPVVALALAGSFGLYGLLRKIVRVDALIGLTVETTLLLPLAIGYLAYLVANGRCTFGTTSRTTDVLLGLCGVVTAVPLLWFTNAARRLRLATLGFLQYIAPTLQFLLAVALYREKFTRVHMVAFGTIWAALAIYSADAVTQKRKSITGSP